MHAKRSNICSRLTADPENTKLPFIIELVKLALVDGSNAQLSLDGGNKRRALEEGTGESFESAGELSLSSRKFVVKPDDTHVLLSCSLLGLDETSSAVDADNKTSRDFRIKRSTMAGFLDSRIWN